MIDWSKRRVLITGAAGFIGSHLTEQLLLAGAKVRAFVRYNSRGDLGLLTMLPKDRIKTIEIVLGDLCDPQALSTAVKSMDVVFHLGAMIAIPYSYVHPIHVVQANVMGTAYLLEAIRQHGVEYMVNISTSEVYGSALYVPIDEMHPLQGQSPYSASKIGAEKIAESYYRSFGLPIATLRPFNTYGPRQSARAVIPSIVTQALTRDEIHLGSLAPTRDLNFVLDTVRGMMQAAGVGALLGRSTNIGTGTEISVGDLANKIIAMIGRKVEVVQDSERLRPSKSEVARLVAESSFMRQATGWNNVVSLDDGLTQTIEWIRRHPTLYRPEEYAV